ncbi:MAG: hypothetical protein V2I43_03530 [Parvularcula sp.]|jgi:tetratricopeptide (TPR) repeat protein|nr:hypothetical protein [Parvularcula sp.]
MPFMGYALSSGLDWFQHLETLNTIEKSGRRVEAAIHSGLMALATEQAKAMKDLGTKIDDRLVQLDATIDTRFDEIHSCLDGISAQIGYGFSAMDERLSDIGEALDRIDYNTANPEESRARERFRRAIDLYKKGHHVPALEAVDHAIANDGGPSFAHVSEFQTLKAMLHMGSPDNRDLRVVDPAKANAAYREAARYTEVRGDSSRVARGDLHYQAGLAAYAAANPAEALLDFQRVVSDYEGVENKRIGKNSALAHFQIARCSLHLRDDKAAERHLLRAIDLDWKLLAMVASDPDCIVHQDFVEPIVSAYVGKTLPEARRMLDALSWVLADAGPRNVRTMHEKLHAATIPEGLECRLRKRWYGSSLLTPSSYSHVVEKICGRHGPMYRLADQFWNRFSPFKPYPVLVRDDVLSSLRSLAQASDRVGLADIAMAMERIEEDYAIRDALRYTGKFWRLTVEFFENCIATGYKNDKIELIISTPFITKREFPRLDRSGGFFAQRAAKKAHEEALRRRAIAMAEDEAALERDWKKVNAHLSRELDPAVRSCLKLARRACEIHERAGAGGVLLSPTLRWQHILKDQAR